MLQTVYIIRIKKYGYETDALALMTYTNVFFKFTPTFILEFV